MSASPGSPKQRIGYRMAQDVRIGMALKSKGMIDRHAAQDEKSSGQEAMHIITDAAGKHHIPSSTIPFEATMENFSAADGWGVSTTLPPALSSRRIPAATSHRLMLLSM